MYPQEIDMLRSKHDRLRFYLSIIVQLLSCLIRVLPCLLATTFIDYSVATISLRVKPPYHLLCHVKFE